MGERRGRLLPPARLFNRLKKGKKGAFIFTSRGCERRKEGGENFVRLAYHLRGKKRLQLLTGWSITKDGKEGEKRRDLLSPTEDNVAA